MAARPYTSLAPKNVTWFPDIDTFARAGGVAPIDNAKPRKLWKDNAPYPAFGNFWQGLTSGARSYKFIARAADGTPLLCEIGSKEFFDTYTSLAVVGQYKEWAYLLGKVPYLETRSVAAEHANINLGSNGTEMDVPVELPSDTMLVYDPTAPGQVVAWQYQEFGKQAKPPEMPLPDRLRMIDAVRASAMGDAEQLAAIRAICTDWYPRFTLT